MFTVVTNKKNLARTSREYLYSCKALSSKNEWLFFLIDDLINLSHF